MKNKPHPQPPPLTDILGYQGCFTFFQQQAFLSVSDIHKADTSRGKGGFWVGLEREFICSSPKGVYRLNVLGAAVRKHFCEPESVPNVPTAARSDSIVHLKASVPATSIL